METGKKRRCPMKKRGRYPREFKIEAVRFLNADDKPASELAMELGVKRTLLYRWRDQFTEKGDSAFCGSGRPKSDQLSEVSRLKKELKEVKEERDILKKAAAYFAKDLR
ncbi:MAG: transposase [Candidatus Aureabacteria bacterium]|nr:transposase [Candidatus Auribacterota bacterium]